MLKKFYEDYVCLCLDYQNGAISNETAVSELKTIQESIGIYISGVFELIRRKKGGE